MLRVLMKCDRAWTLVVTLEVAKQHVKQILVPEATSHPSTCATQPGFLSHSPPFLGLESFRPWEGHLAVS